MRTVLRRNEDNTISHVSVGYYYGYHFYLTTQDHAILLEMDSDKIGEYYKNQGYEHEAVEDLEQLIDGYITLEFLQFRVAKNLGLFQDDVIYHDSNDNFFTLDGNLG